MISWDELPGFLQADGGSKTPPRPWEAFGNEAAATYPELKALANRAGMSSTRLALELLLARPPAPLSREQLDALSRDFGLPAKGTRAMG